MIHDESEHDKSEKGRREEAGGGEVTQFLGHLMSVVLDP